MDYKLKNLIAKIVRPENFLKSGGSRRISSKLYRKGVVLLPLMSVACGNIARIEHLILSVRKDGEIGQKREGKKGEHQKGTLLRKNLEKEIQSMNQMLFLQIQ